jgi:thioredoxin 1
MPREGAIHAAPRVKALTGAMWNLANPIPSRHPAGRIVAMRRPQRTFPLHPTAETFNEEVLQSHQPVLVDFWAPWCPSCMMLKPEMERLAIDLNGRAKVAFVNVDEEPELASLLCVSSIPALIIMKDGRRVDAWTGYAPRAAILARIEKHLTK